MFDVGGILFGEPDDDADDVIDERAATVKHVLPPVGSSLRWDYDFGDGVGARGVGRGDRVAGGGHALPGVSRGAMACPPEDCGGVSGYARLLAALVDPTDPEHEALVEWAPDGFAPEAFDLAAANRRLRGLSPRGPTPRRSR
jgi:hypothetical protein